jgi:signal recognition particle subunit SRP54
MLKGAKIDERQMDRMVAIVRSMTPHERRNPKTIDGSRKKRIAMGSGNSVQAVNQLLKQFSAMQQMFARMSKGKMKGLPRNMMPF